MQPSPPAQQRHWRGLRWQLPREGSKTAENFEVTIWKEDKLRLLVMLQPMMNYPAEDSYQDAKRSFIENQSHPSQMRMKAQPIT